MLTSEGQILIPQNTRSQKIRNAPSDPKLNLNTYTVKSTLYTLIACEEAQILVRVALRLTVSGIQRHQTSEMHRMTPNWTWTLNSQKYPIYTNTSEAQILARFAQRTALLKISHIL